jgi:hypothetical protein
MNTDIIKDVKHPETENGLYVVTYIDENCNIYTSHMLAKQFAYAVYVDSLRELKYDMEVLKKLIELYKETEEENNDYR